MGNYLNDTLRDDDITTEPVRVVKYEYETTLLCREDDLDVRTNKLYKDGWEYVGQLCSNGINCSYVQFRKEINFFSWQHWMTALSQKMFDSTSQQIEETLGATGEDSGVSLR